MNPTTAALLAFLRSNDWDVRLRFQPREVLLPTGTTGRINPALSEFLSLVKSSLCI